MPTPLYPTLSNGINPRRAVANAMMGGPAPVPAQSVGHGMVALGNAYDQSQQIQPSQIPISPPGNGPMLPAPPVGPADARAFLMNSKINGTPRNMYGRLVG